MGSAQWRPDEIWGCPEEDRPPVQELRIAASFSGGVSLAIWMGGLTFELDRLLRSSDAERSSRKQRKELLAPGDEVYAALLALLRIDADVDVITGTSAGGINGVVLAMARAHGSDLSPLLPIWLDEGSFTKLLRDPEEQDPPSLMNGDEVLLRALKQGLEDLQKPTGEGRRTATDQGDADALASRTNPMTLLVTSTMMEPDTTVVRDALGTAVYLQDNQALFRFTQWPPRFHEGEVKNSEEFDPDRLARAARSSASYPLAFEPSFVAIGTAEPGPDMAPALQLLSSRWMIDGGLRNNQPVGTALRAIWDQPAGRGARRVMLHIVPDPGQSSAGVGGDIAPSVPNLMQALSATAKAPLVQSWSTDLKESRQRSSDAARRAQGTQKASDALANAGGTAVRLLEALRETRPQWVADDFVSALDKQCSRQSTTQSPRTTLGNQVGSSARFDTLQAACRQKALAHWAGDGTSVTARSLTVFGPDLFNGTFGETLRLIRAKEKQAPSGQADRWANAAKSLHEARASDGIPVRWERDHLRDFLLGKSSVSLDGGEALFDEWLREAFPRAGQAAGHATGDGIAALKTSWTALLEWADTTDGRELFGADTAAEAKERMLLRGALWLLLGGRERDGQEVDLVQMSAYTRSLIAPDRFKTPAEKLTGVGMAHFGAFASRACRANDWMWGRLDGAGWLVHLLLSPARLREIAAARYGSLPPLEQVRKLIDDDLKSISCGGNTDLEAFWHERMRCNGPLAREIEALASADRNLPQALPELSMLVAYGIQWRIAAESLACVAEQLEQPELAGGPPPELNRTESLLVKRINQSRRAGPTCLDPRTVEELLLDYQLPETRPLNLLARPELRGTALGALAVGSAAVDHATPEGVPVLKKATEATTRVARGLARSVRSDTPAGWLAVGMLALGVLLLIIGGPVATAIGLPLAVSGGLAVTTSALGRPGFIQAARRWVLLVGGVAGIAAGAYVAMIGVSDEDVSAWVAQNAWFDTVLFVLVAMGVMLIAWVISRLLTAAARPHQ